MEAATTQTLNKHSLSSVQYLGILLFFTMIFLHVLRDFIHGAPFNVLIVSLTVGGDRGDSRECFQDLAVPPHPVL